MKPDFNVLIVYDEFVSGQRAVQTYYRLMLQHGDLADVSLKTWTFDLLKNAKINRAAVEDAADAQLIILAAGCETLPAAVERWLKAWRLRASQGSFIAVLGPPEEVEKDLSPVEDELQSIFSGTEIDFLVEKIGRWRTREAMPMAAVA